MEAITCNYQESDESNKTDEQHAEQLCPKGDETPNNCQHVGDHGSQNPGQNTDHRNHYHHHRLGECEEKCSNKKPLLKRGQKCPDHSLNSFHVDLRVQNYLYLENNRLYCHNIFNKAGMRVWDVERNNPKNSCFWPLSAECHRRRAASLAIFTYQKWLDDHKRRNDAYISNCINPFTTNNWKAYKPGGDFRRKVYLFRKPC